MRLAVSKNFNNGFLQQQLLVGAQSGFLDGPAVLSNMASDSGYRAI